MFDGQLPYKIERNLQELKKLLPIERKIGDKANVKVTENLIMFEEIKKVMQKFLEGEKLESCIKEIETIFKKDKRDKK